MGFKKYLDSLKLYESGKPVELIAKDYGVKAKDIIKLASNENPMGASKKVQKTIKQEAQNVFRYPDDSMFELKESLSKKFKISHSNLIIGSGSDQIIDFVVKCVCLKDSKVLMSALTFAMYEIYSNQNEAQIIKTKDGIHIVSEFIDAIKKHNPSLVFLCVPNNPLGDCLSKDEVFEILDAASKDCIIVVDCAYMEFAKYKDKSKEIIPSELIQKYKNVIYLGTFSKLYAIGGLRVGYGIADSAFIQTISKLRPPFNVTNISIQAAITALNDSNFVSKTLKNNLKEMKVYEDFARKHNINFINSYANFITFIISKGLNSSDLCEFLLKKGVIIRDLKSYGINAIRITIGTKSQNKAVLKLISRYLKR